MSDRRVLTIGCGGAYHIEYMHEYMYVLRIQRPNEVKAGRDEWRVQSVIDGERGLEQALMSEGARE